MALAGRRASTASPRGTITLPKRVVGQAGTPKPIEDPERANGATVPLNPQKLDGTVENEPELNYLPTRRSVVDSEYTPLSHIIVNAEGDKWPNDYYKAQVGMNDELMPLAQGTAVPHQQYIEIKDFIIHVTAPLQQQQDQETKEFTVTGEGTVFYGLIPNKGDMFVADVGDGRAGAFTITETERLSYSKEACYRISYVLTDYLTQAIEGQLTAKTVKTYHFELALVEMHESPYLTESDYQMYVSLNEQSGFLTNHFNRLFWARVAQTVALPQQRSLTFDAFHADFCMNVGLGGQHNPITMYSNGYVKISEIYTIWNILKDMDAGQIPYAHPTFGIASAEAFFECTANRGIAWSQFAYTVYPTSDFVTGGYDEQIRTAVAVIKDHLNGDPDYNGCKCCNYEMLDYGIVDQYRFKLPRDLCGCCDDEDEPTTPPEPSTPPVDPEKPQPPIVPPRPKPMFPLIGVTQHYVLSKAFYEGDRELMSKFELVIMDMLEGKPILTKDVSMFCQAIRKHSQLQQFYFIPIILMLIRYSQRGSLKWQ